MSKTFRLIQLLYLLRVPLLVCGAQFALALAVLAAPEVVTLLPGLFDLQPRGLLVVCVLAFLLVVVETVTSEIVLRCGPKRFHLPSLPSSWAQNVPRWKFGLQIQTVTAWLLAVYMLGAAAVTGTALYLSTTITAQQKALTLLGGVAAALILVIFVAYWWRRDWAFPFAHRAMLFVFRWMSADPEGYLTTVDRNGEEAGEPRLIPVHTFAAALTAVWVLLYVVLGVIGDPAQQCPCDAGLTTPAIGSVLILMTILCLVLGALAFWLDRYRLPTILPIVIVGMITSFCPRSDHTFLTIVGPPVDPLTPREVLDATQPAGTDSIIVVATSGGGIHAAAWTTTVLAHLTHSASTTDLPGGPDAFPRAIRLISSVSGGSVGSLYFAAAYQDGRIPPEALQAQVIDPPRRSSLDAAGWGIAYPDLLRLIPLIPAHVNSGWALEQAWSCGMQFPQRLSDWRKDVSKGLRPAQIFNSTLVETGERAVIGTVDVPLNATEGKSLRDTAFYALYRNLDLSPVTAARVSATFPYVTPASRPENVRACQSYHMADGGYYDNYGIVSVTEFLRHAIPHSSIKHILLIQIDDGLPAESDRGATQRGPFFQIVAPVKTLLNVRDTSQRARNNLDIELLTTYVKTHAASLCVARFTYPTAAPLSWHLTRKQQGEIDSAWKDPTIAAEAEKVIDFLRAAKQSAK